METSSYPRRTLDRVGCVTRPILDSLEEHSTQWGGYPHNTTAGPCLRSAQGVRSKHSLSIRPLRRCPTTSNVAERCHHTRLQLIDYRPTRPRRSPSTKHSTRWGGGSNCCPDETSTRHGGVLSAHLALLHRPAGSSVIYSSLSNEEGECTRNVLALHCVGLRACLQAGQNDTRN